MSESQERTMTTDLNDIRDRPSESAAEAATFLAPIFAEQGWVWATCSGVPTRDDIFRALCDLARSAQRNGKYASSGRLSAHVQDEGARFETIEFSLDVSSYFTTPEQVGGSVS